MTIERGDEELIVVPTAALRELGPAPGFVPEIERFVRVAFQPGVARGMARSRAEEDPRYKQLVAYVVLRHQDRIFHYQRSQRAGEQRLAGRRSLGVGGHVNAEDWRDGGGWNALTRGITRELIEEVDLAQIPQVTYLGVIDDDADPVSRVHLGIVALASLDAASVRLRDPTLQDARFDPVDVIRARLDDFEGWSRGCLPWVTQMIGARSP